MRDIYVFDLDNTLVDSARQISYGILTVLDEAGVSYPDNFIKTLTPLGYTTSAKLFVEMGVPGTAQEIYDRMMGYLVNEYANNVKLRPGVREFLQKKHDQGAELYVLTASPHELTDVTLQSNGIWDLFRNVWSVEDFGINKSDVRIYQEVAKLLGCETKDIKFFDDNITAVSTAKAAGCFSTAVRDRHTDAEFAEFCAAADAHINSFEDLL